jgi:lipopolysaccharide export system permease protein
MTRTGFFPSRTLALYVGKMFLVRSFAVLAMLVLILMALDLLGETGKILAVPGNGQDEIIHYIGLRIPQLIARFLPFSVLLGTLITLVTLNQNSEIIMMKAAGLSAHQVLAPLFIVAFLVAAISFAFNERVVARSTAALAAWQKLDYKPVPKDTGLTANIWVIDGANLLGVDVVQVQKGKAPVLRDVVVYDRSSGALDAVITAALGTPATGGGWSLANATRFDVKSGIKTAIGTAVVGQDVTLEQLLLAKVNADGLNFFELRDTIAALKAVGRPTRQLEGSLWHKLAAPLSALLMPLLGAVAGFGLARSGKLFVRIVIGMGLGFLYFVADNFALAMGNLGAYPPWLSAWGPFFLFLLIGETVLVRIEK